ncbi:hypothetical protein IMZ11_02195 [Microtetraspora sp. AC03309]|uniref:hypothetical protein n=1 Tax=Microtetraspora sp. AC03309 TaxID=2779376 RepID=UPI001E2DA263|nr:hypothetical protein [Microtetraspora sp. AC03309]MCC5574451.1 hypothetical protein [Microtetraspora sp. AC03309]
MALWRGINGYEVEHIMLGNRPTLRVSKRVRGARVLVAYCRSVREVAEHVDLADLVEVVELPRAQGLYETRRNVSTDPFRSRSCW